MLEHRNWTVEIRVAYDVNAISADQALSAVLPLVSLGPDRYGPQPKIADYTVREISSSNSTAVPWRGGSASRLKQGSVHAKEVAEILHISLNSVYSRVPSMTIGGSRRYTRAAVLNVLEHGIERDARPQRPVRAYYDRPMRVEKPAKIVRQKREKPDSPFVTIAQAAQILRISKYKMRQLIDEKKIYYHESYGRKTISREAVQHYIDGLEPRAFVEKRLAEVKDDPVFRTPEEFKAFADEWLAKWPEEPRPDTSS